MTSLREKIEGLPDVAIVSGRAIAGAVDRADVLRIIAEHEADSDTLLKISALFNGWANAGPPDGGPCNVRTAAGVLAKIGAALGDPFDPDRLDKNLPAGQIPAYLCAPCYLEVEVGETFGSCPKCSKPMEMNPRWVASSAEVPKWRQELDRLRRQFAGSAGTVIQGQLEKLAILHDVVTSGKGEAVVPESVANLLPVWKLQAHAVYGSDQNGGKEMTALRDRNGGLSVLMTKQVMDAINQAGNSLLQ